MKPLDKRKLIDIPVIDLGDIYLRAIEYNDYKDMFEYGSDTRVTNTLTWHMKTIEEAESLITSIHISRPERNIPITYVIVNKSNDKMIGTCDYYDIDWEKATGEIGYAIHFDYWGKGYMTKTCKALVEFGFTYLGLDNVTISHEISNIGSQRVIEKSGFHFIEEKILKRNNAMCKFYKITRKEYMKESL